MATQIPNAVSNSVIETASAVVQASGAEPGYTTTEFWMSLVTMFIGLLTSTGIIHPSTATVNGIVGLVAMVVPALAYAVSRGVRKSGTPG